MSTWRMNVENVEMYWKKQKHEQNNNARLTKEWLREKKKNAKCNKSTRCHDRSSCATTDNSNF
jgi:hypothetical protein